MKTELENRQVTNVESNRAVAEPAHVGTPHVKDIGEHQHGWEFYARAADGEYQVCQLCGARRVLGAPLVVALHRDWIEGSAKWKPSEDEAEPELMVTIPVPAPSQDPAARDDGYTAGEDEIPDRPRRGRPPKKQD